MQPAQVGTYGRHVGPYRMPDMGGLLGATPIDMPHGWEDDGLTMSSGQIPAEAVWFMLGLALAAVLTLVVVSIGVGGTIFTLTKRHLPANRFVRTNMVLSIVVLGLALAWWATLAIAHNLQGL